MVVVLDDSWSVGMVEVVEINQQGRKGLFVVVEHGIGSYTDSLHVVDEPAELPERQPVKLNRNINTHPAIVAVRPHGCR